VITELTRCAADPARDNVEAFSWALVHTVYALRSGDLYYATPTGGIDFNDSGEPDDRDFAYLALTIGMTYQVSDTTSPQGPSRGRRCGRRCSRSCSVPSSSR
jgi:hypothetical protein